MSGLGLILVTISVLWMLYLVWFFSMDFRYEADTKKQFILQFIIPFYWWGFWGVGWLKETMEAYKEL